MLGLAMGLTLNVNGLVIMGHVDVFVLHTLWTVGFLLFVIRTRSD